MMRYVAGVCFGFIATLGLVGCKQEEPDAELQKIQEMMLQDSLEQEQVDAEEQKRMAADLAAEPPLVDDFDPASVIVEEDDYEEAPTLPAPPEPADSSGVSGGAATVPQ